MKVFFGRLAAVVVAAFFAVQLAGCGQTNVAVRVAVEPTLEYDQVLSFVEPAWEYDWVSPFGKNLFIVSIQVGWGAVTGYKRDLIDKNGKEVLPVEYDRIYYFGDDVAFLVKDGKWGIIDKNGKLILSLEYEWIQPFNEGFATVVKDGKYGILQLVDKRSLEEPFKRTGREG